MKGSRLPAHPFAEEADFPPDHRGRSRCTTCGLLGAAGDQRHPTAGPATQPRPISPDLVEAYRERDAAILGESD